MFHLAKALYLHATSQEEYSILVLGLDNAGKTTLLEQIKALNSPHGHPNLNTVPTVGQNVTTISLGHMYLKIWDVGGQHSLRRLWQNYYSSCHAIVFVIDSSDVGNADIGELSSTRKEKKKKEHNDDGDESGDDDGDNTATKGADDSITLGDYENGRLDECRLVLEHVLQNSHTEGVPLLVLANKQDLEDCVEVVRIKEGFIRKVFEGDKGGSLRDSRVLPCSALTGTGVKDAVEWLCSRVVWNKEHRPPQMR